MTEAGLTGHLCFATMHTESVAETINRAIQTYPPDQQAGMASRLAGALRVILVQRLLKTTDGKRAAIREYLVFDREVRNELQSLPYTDWGRFIGVYWRRPRPPWMTKPGVCSKRIALMLASSSAWPALKSSRNAGSWRV